MQGVRGNNSPSMAGTKTRGHLWQARQWGFHRWVPAKSHAMKCRCRTCRILKLVGSSIFLSISAGSYHYILFQLESLEHSGRDRYIEEVNERIMTGRQRVKKRTRSVVKTATLQVSNQLKGTFVEYEQYKKDWRLKTEVIQMVPIQLIKSNSNLNINSHSQLLIWHRRRIHNCGARPMVMSCCWCWSSRIVVVWHFHFQFCSQDFGSPNRNGLGHKVCKTVDPVSQKQVDAVFVPKLKKGYWQGSISNIQQLSDSTVVDDDANSLRVNQLLLARTCPSHRCNDIFFMIWDMIMNHAMNNLNNIIYYNIRNIISISVPGSLFHCTDSGTDWNWFWNCTDTDIVLAPVGYFAYDF